MKIFILPVPTLLQPQQQPFPYPAHNHDYGVEQDFLLWLQHPNQKKLITQNPQQADWHYLPVFWTRWYLNHNFAVDNAGVQEAQEAIDKIILQGDKTFTICQFDGGGLVKIPGWIQFLAARTQPHQGIDIPILCKPHTISPFTPQKKYLASFNGAPGTNILRQEMLEKFSNRKDIKLGSYLPTRFYLRWLGFKSFNRVMRESWIALCPRGTSMNSFRFFEAMQLGVIPCLIGDEDARPFKNFINWNNCSFQVNTINELEALLNQVKPNQLLHMSQNVKNTFTNEIAYQKWCKYVIMELNAIKPTETDIL
jgi:hypothetical protein